jgi:O-methyltransferase
MQVASNDEIFAAPLKVEDPADCHFYHTMEVPGHGIMTGDWDLRGGVDDYLGKVALAGQRVLEIGPASGFLTFEMEKRGADVVSVEVTAEHGWDFVPYPANKLEEVFGPRANHMERLKNSYWFSHAAHQSKAKVYYGDVYNLPAALGQFDIAVMGSVLLHCRDPLRIVEQCGKMARSIIITDMFYPDLEGTPVCRLLPAPQNFRWDTWWQFSTQFFTQFLAVMGFTTAEILTHEQHRVGRADTFFTIVAQRSVLKAKWRMLGASKFPPIALLRSNMKKLLGR